MNISDSGVASGGKVMATTGNALADRDRATFSYSSVRYGAQRLNEYQASINLDPNIYTEYSDYGVNKSGILHKLDYADNMSDAIDIQYGRRQEMFDNKYFNRYRMIYPGDELVTGKKYCFIVKPDLNILDAAEKDPYFYNLLLTKPYIAQSLTHVDILTTGMAGGRGTNGITEDNHFISFLTPRAMSFSLPDFQVQEYKLDQPFTGFSTSYAGNSNDIRTNQSTQVQFRETDNLDVTALFDAWVKYIDLVSYGVVSPYYDYATARMTYGVPIIDYATSIYEIITKPDGNDIIYWAKFTGLFPTMMPHSNFQFTYEDRMDNGVEIQFSGGLPETLNPKILAEFNYNAGIFADAEDGLPTQVRIESPRHVPNSRNFADVEGTPSGASVVGAPFITFDGINGCYKLRWRPIPES